jgi:hypothetical protein
MREVHSRAKKWICLDDREHGGPAPHDDRDFYTEASPNLRRNCARYTIGDGPRRRKDDIAALDDSLNPIATDVLEDRLEIAHRDVVGATDVDAAKERDIGVHTIGPVRALKHAHVQFVWLRSKARPFLPGLRPWAHGLAD